MTTRWQRLVIVILLAVWCVGVGAVLRQPSLDAASLAMMVWAPVGALLAWRLPHNQLGWLLLGVGLLASLMALASATLPEQSVSAAEVTPAAVLAGWVLSWAWYPLMASSAVLTPMLFPDGWLTPSWRRLGRGLAGFTVLFTVALSTVPSFELGRSGITVRNPVYSGPTLPEPLGDAIYLVGLLVLVSGIVTALASVVVRYRRGDQVQRLQVRWFLAAVVAVVAATTVELVLADSYDVVTSALIGVSLAIIPLAVGIAVSRHGLYEIDRLISRSVSYLLVTAAVVATYAGVVTSVSRLLPLSSSVGVAAATLASAAIFRPALRRARTIVDSRFDRERYNAQHTVEALADRLRDEVNPDTAAVSLVVAIEETLQPVSVRIWTRPT